MSENTKCSACGIGFGASGGSCSWCNSKIGSSSFFSKNSRESLGASSTDQPFSIGLKPAGSFSSGIEKERYEKSQSSLPTDVFSGNVKEPLHEIGNIGKNTVIEDDKRGRDQTTADDTPVLSKNEIEHYKRMSAHDRKRLATQFSDVVEDSKKRGNNYVPSQEYLAEIARQKAHLEILTELNQEESKEDSLSKFSEGGQITSRQSNLLNVMISQWKSATDQETKELLEAAMTNSGLDQTDSGWEYKGNKISNIIHKPEERITEEDEELQRALANMLAFSLTSSGIPGGSTSWSNIEKVMESVGAERVGKIGDIVPFHGMKHKTNDQILPDEQAEVTRSGWDLPLPPSDLADYKRDYQILPAEVQTPVVQMEEEDWKKFFEEKKIEDEKKSREYLEDVYGKKKEVKSEFEPLQSKEIKGSKNVWGNLTLKKKGLAEGGFINPYVGSLPSPENYPELEKDLFSNACKVRKLAGGTTGGKISHDLLPHYKALRAGVAEKVVGSGYEKYAMRLFRHAVRSDEVLKNIPEGSEFLGHGISALAFREPEGGDVVRVQPEVAHGLSQKWTDKILEAGFFSTKRPDIPEVLQAKSSQNLQGKSGQVFLEKLPFTRDINHLSSREKQAVINKLKWELEKKKLKFIDDHAGNVGETDEGYKIIDPGAIGPDVHRDLAIEMQQRAAMMKKARESYESTFVPQKLAEGGEVHQGLMGKFFSNFLHPFDPLTAFPALAASKAALTGMKHIFGWEQGGEISEGTTSKQEQLRSLVAEKTEELTSQYDSQKGGKQQSWFSKILGRLDWSKYGTMGAGVPSSISGAVIGAPSAMGVGLLGTALGSMSMLTDPLAAGAIGAGVGALYPVLRHPVEAVQLGLRMGKSLLKNVLNPKKSSVEIPPSKPVSEYDEQFNDLYNQMKVLGESPIGVMGHNPPEKFIGHLNEMADKANELGIPPETFWTTQWGKVKQEEVPTAFSAPELDQFESLQTLGRAATYDADKYGTNKKKNKTIFDKQADLFKKGLATAIQGFASSGDIESAKKLALENLQFNKMLEEQNRQYTEALIAYQGRPVADLEQEPFTYESEEPTLLESMSDTDLDIPVLSEPKEIDKFKKGKRFKPDFREEVIDLFDSGVSLSLIASKFEVPKAPIHGILKRAKRLEEGGQIDFSYGGQIHLLNDGRVVPTSGGIVGGGGNTDQDQGISLPKGSIVLNKKATELLGQDNASAMNFAKGGETGLQPVALMPGERVILDDEVDQMGGATHLLGINAAARNMEDGGEIQNLAEGTKGSVPFMITKDMESKLSKMGFTEKQIKSMVPEQAWNHINSSKKPDDIGDISEDEARKLLDAGEVPPPKEPPSVSTASEEPEDEGKRREKFRKKLPKRFPSSPEKINELQAELYAEDFPEKWINDYFTKKQSGSQNVSKQVIGGEKVGESTGQYQGKDYEKTVKLTEGGKNAIVGGGELREKDKPIEIASLKSQLIDKQIEEEIFGRRSEKELKDRTEEEQREEAEIFRKTIEEMKSGTSKDITFESVSKEYNRKREEEISKLKLSGLNIDEIKKEHLKGLITSPKEVEKIIRSKAAGGIPVSEEENSLEEKDLKESLENKIKKIKEKGRTKEEKENEWADLALKELENVTSPGGLATFVAYLRKERSARQIGLNLNRSPVEVKESFGKILQKVWENLPQEIPKSKIKSLVEIGLKERKKQEKIIGEIDESIRQNARETDSGITGSNVTGSEKKVEPSTGLGTGDSGIGGKDQTSGVGEKPPDEGIGSGAISSTELEKIKKARHNRIKAELERKLGRKANPAEYVQAELGERRGIQPSMKQVKKELAKRAVKAPSYKEFLKSPEYQDWKSLHPYGPEQNFPMMSPEDIKEHEALQLEYDDKPGLGLGLEKNHGVYSRPKTEKELEEEKYKEIYEKESKRKRKDKIFTDYSLEEKQTALGRAEIDITKTPAGMKTKNYKFSHPEEQLEIQYTKATEVKKAEVMKHLASLSPEYLFHPGWSGGGRKDPPIDTIFGNEDGPEDSGKKKKFSYKRAKFGSKEEESLYKSLQRVEQDLLTTDRSKEGGEEEYNNLLKERIRLLKEIESIQERRKSLERNLFFDQLKSTEGMERQKKFIIGGFQSRLDQSKEAKVNATLSREYAATPEGKASQKEYYRNTGFAQPNEFEQRKAQRQIAIGASIGEFGTPMGLVIGHLKTTGMALEEFGNHFKRIFAYGAAAIGGLIASASPDAWATITGSVRLLSAVIGMQFLPLALRVAGAIQNMVFWWLDLDKTTKSNLATWVTWGLGIAGAGAAIGKLGTILTGFGSILSFGFRHPFIAAAGAIGILLHQSGLLIPTLELIGGWAKSAADWMSKQSTATLALVGALGLLAPALLRVAAASVFPSLNLLGSSGMGAASGLGNRLGIAALGLGIAGHSIYQATAGEEGFGVTPSGGLANTLGAVGGLSLAGGMIPSPIAPYLLALGAAASLASIAVRTFADSATSSARRVSSISGLARTPEQVEASIVNVQNINRRIEELRTQPGGAISPEMVQLLEQRRTEYNFALRPELRRRIREAPEEYRGTLIQQQLESFGTQRTTAESGMDQRTQSLAELIQSREPGILQAIQTGNQYRVSQRMDRGGVPIPLSPSEQVTQTRYDELNRRVALIRNQITPESLRLAETRGLFTRPPTGPGFEGVQFGDQRHIEELVSVLSGRDEIRNLTAAIEVLTGVLRSGVVPPENPGSPSLPIGLGRSRRETEYRRSLMSEISTSDEERERLQSGSVQDVETGVIRSLRESATQHRTRFAELVGSNPEEATRNLRAAESIEGRLAEVRMRIDAFRSTPEARQSILNQLESAITRIRATGSLRISNQEGGPVGVQRRPTAEYPSIPPQFYDRVLTGEEGISSLQRARDIFRTTGGGSGFWTRMMEQMGQTPTYGLPATPQAALDPRNARQIAAQQPGLARENNATFSAMMGLSNFQSRQIQPGDLFDLIQSEAIRAPLDQAIFIAQQKSLEELVRLAGGERLISERSAENLQRIVDSLRSGIGTGP